jgi:hypothetical protein
MVIKSADEFGSGIVSEACSDPNPATPQNDSAATGRSRCVVAVIEAERAINRPAVTDACARVAPYAKMLFNKKPQTKHIANRNGAFTDASLLTVSSDSSTGFSYYRCKMVQNRALTSNMLKISGYIAWGIR